MSTKKLTVDTPRSKETPSPTLAHRKKLTRCCLPLKRQVDKPRLFALTVPMQTWGASLKKLASSLLQVRLVLIKKF